MHLGELMFFVDPEGARRENLLIAPDGRDAFLSNFRSPSSCAVVMGCGGRGCSDQLAVDGGPDRRQPLRTVQLYWLNKSERESWMAGTAASDTEPLSWLETLAVMQFPPGEHRLKFSSRHFSGEHELSLACRRREIVYLVVNATDNERFFKRALVDWEVERSESMPIAFARRPRVILYGGEWFVEAGRVD